MSTALTRTRLFLIYIIPRSFPLTSMPFTQTYNTRPEFMQLLRDSIFNVRPHYSTTNEYYLDSHSSFFHFIIPCSFPLTSMLFTQTYNTQPEFMQLPRDSNLNLRPHYSSTNEYYFDSHSSFFRFIIPRSFPLTSMHFSQTYMLLVQRDTILGTLM